MRARLGVLLVLACGAAFPLLGVLPDPAGRMVGVAGGDGLKHAWSFWHTLAQLQALDWPHTRWLNAPAGGVFLDPMLWPAVLLAPVTATLGPVASANLFAWCALLGLGAATWWLCIEVVGWGPGALVGAVLSQTAPFVLGFPLAGGVLERLQLWVFPLVVVLVLKNRRRARPLWALLAGIAAFAAAVSCPVYGVFLVVLGLLGAPLWLSGPGGLAGGLRAQWGVVLALGLGVMGAAFVGLWLTDGAHALAPQPGRTALWPAGPMALPMALTPGRLLDPLTVAAQPPFALGDTLFELGYLGWAPLILGMVGCVLAPAAARWRVVGLAGLGCTMALLALGYQVGLGGVQVPNPLFWVLAWVVPTYGQSPPIWQQVGLWTPLMAPALAAAIGGFPRTGGRWAWAVGAAALVLAERALVLPLPLVLPTHSAAVSTAYAGVGSSGALAEIPRAVDGGLSADGRQFLAQTQHRRPVVFSINLGTSELDWYAPVVLGEARDWAGATHCLRRAGVRWVALHTDWFAEPTTARLAQAGLDRAASLVGDDGGVRLYDLGPAAVAPTWAPAPRIDTVGQLEDAGVLGDRPPVGSTAPDLQRCPVPL